MAAKSWLQLGAEGFGPGACRLDHAGEKAVGQQVDIFGKQAEEQADDEMGDLGRVFTVGGKNLESRANCTAASRVTWSGVWAALRASGAVKAARSTASLSGCSRSSRLRV